MIYSKIEGQAPRQGLNIYPKDDPYSKGFVIRIWYWVLSVRQSKILDRWVVRTYWLGRRG